MAWYSHLLENFPQFVVLHTVKGFGVVNEAEIDIFLVREGNSTVAFLLNPKSKSRFST